MLTVDNDGIPDVVEAFGISFDDDGDGVIDNFTDADGDGIDDSWLPIIELPTDTDGDGIEDALELDSDGDGIADLVESGGTDLDGSGTIDNFTDLDADGIDDAVAAVPAMIIDTDGDGSPDYRDLDSDNDGVSDIEETGGIDADGDLVIRRRATVVKKGAGKAASVAAVAIASLFLGGCASIGGASSGGFSKDEVTTGYVDEFSRGLYAAAGIGPSRLEPDASQVAGFDLDDRVEPAGQVTLGVDVTKHFSVEAHSADLGSAGFSQGGRINYHVNGVSALFYAGGNRHRFRRQGLTAFGRLGVGVLDNTTVGDVPFEKVNGTHVLFGAGLEYMTPIGLGLRLEGVSFDEDVQYGQLGVMYRTGRKQGVVRPKLSQAPVAPEPEVAAAVAPPPPPPPVFVPPPVQVVDQCAGLNGVLEGVNFHSDSAELTDSSMDILDDAANRLGTCQNTQVEISAHTDSVGAESYNQALSERRARSVVEYLNASGLSRGRFTATAFGESSPIDTNETAQGRARNRRVELYAR